MTPGSTPGATAAQGSSDRTYVDWGSILAGAAVAAGAGVVLTTFAAGLGFGTISVREGQTGVSGLGVVLSGIVTAIGMAAVYMLGGYIAGRMRRPFTGTATDERTARDGIHGLVVWALGMVAAGILAANVVGGTARAVGSAASTAVEAAGSVAGGVVQGAGQAVGGLVQGAGAAVGGVAQGAANVAPELADMLPAEMRANPIDYVTDTLLRPSQPPAPGTSDTEALAQQAATILANTVRTGELSEGDRAYLQQVVAAQTGLSQPEVEARVNEAVERAQALRTEAEARLEQVRAAAEEARTEAAARLEEAEAKAREVAAGAKSAAVLTAFLLAASALLAAAASYIGAVKGGRHRDEGRIWGGLSYRR